MTKVGQAETVKWYVLNNVPCSIHVALVKGEDTPRVFHVDNKTWPSSIFKNEGYKEGEPPYKLIRNATDYEAEIYLKELGFELENITVLEV